MIRVIVLAIVSVSLPGCVAGVCENSVLQRARAPFGNADAVAFERACGATTDFSTQVSIGDRGETPVDGGNIFVAAGAAFDPDSNVPRLRLEWIGQDELLIRYSDTLRPVTRLTRFGRTAIKYAEL